MLCDLHERTLCPLVATSWPQTVLYLVRADAEVGHGRRGLARCHRRCRESARPAESADHASSRGTKLPSGHVIEAVSAATAGRLSLAVWQTAPAVRYLSLITSDGRTRAVWLDHFPCITNRSGRVCAVRRLFTGAGSPSVT